MQDCRECDKGLSEYSGSAINLNNPQIEVIR